MRKIIKGSLAGGLISVLPLVFLLISGALEGFLGIIFGFLFISGAIIGGIASVIRPSENLLKMGRRIGIIIGILNPLIVCLILIWLITRPSGGGFGGGMFFIGALLLAVILFSPAYTLLTTLFGMLIGWIELKLFRKDLKYEKTPIDTGFKIGLLIGVFISLLWLLIFIILCIGEVELLNKFGEAISYSEINCKMIFNIFVFLSSFSIIFTSGAGGLIGWFVKIFTDLDKKLDKNKKT